MKKNIKKIVISTFLGVVLFFNNTYAFVRISSSISIDKMMQPILSSVINKDGYTLVAFRDLLGMLDVKVDWDSFKRSITAKKDDKTLVIYVDTNKAILNGEDIDMPVGLEIIDGNTYVPLRFICEALGMKVDWDQQKRNVDIETGKDGYLVLNIKNKNSNNNKKISYEDAIKIATSKNTELKNLEDLDNYVNKVKSGLYTKLDEVDYSGNVSNQFPIDGNVNLSPYSAEYSYLDNTLVLLRSIKQNESQSKMKSINEKIISDGVELSVLSSLIAIETTKLNITALEKSIEIGKINIQNLELKNKYGMASETEVKKAKDTNESNESMLKDLKLTLENQQETLNSILGETEDIYIDIEFDLDFNKVNDINLDAYITRSIEGDLSIQVLKNEVDVAEYNYNMSLLSSDEDKTKVGNDLKVAQRKLSDAKVEMEKKLRDNYSNILKYKDKDKTLKIALNQAIDNYNTTVINYINGKTIMYKVEEAKLAILNAEKDIRENELSYFSLMYSFSKPYLLK